MEGRLPCFSVSAPDRGMKKKMRGKGVVVTCPARGQLSEMRERERELGQRKRARENQSPKASARGKEEEKGQPGLETAERKKERGERDGAGRRTLVEHWLDRPKGRGKEKEKEKDWKKEADGPRLGLGRWAPI